MFRSTPHTLLSDDVGCICPMLGIAWGILGTLLCRNTLQSRSTPLLSHNSGRCQASVIQIIRIGSAIPGCSWQADLRAIAPALVGLRDALVQSAPAGRYGIGYGPDDHTTCFASERYRTADSTNRIRGSSHRRYRFARLRLGIRIIQRGPYPHDQPLIASC